MTDNVLAQVRDSSLVRVARDVSVRLLSSEIVACLSPIAQAFSSAKPFIRRE